jgi:alkylation response protein AidB-like acyl-CoA dehydrogenase
VHGGYGFTEEYGIQLYYRRAKAWATSFAGPRRELLTVADRRFGPAAPPAAVSDTVSAVAAGTR